MKTFYLLFLLSIAVISPIFGQLPPETSYGVPETPSDMVMPDYLQIVHDDTYGTDYRRLSDMEAFTEVYGSNFSSYGPICHQYAKTQAWNADNSLIFFGTIFLLNGDDYSINKRIVDYGDDSRWSNTKPDFRYNCRGNYFRKTNVSATPEITDTLIQIQDFNSVRIGPYEGQLSKDDRYVVLTNLVDGAGTKAKVYDIQNNVILSSFANDGFDWASMTPSGDYVVISNNVTGHLELYDLYFNLLRVLSTVTQHGDFAVDAQGNEVFVQVIPLSMIRLSDGVKTDLLPATEHTSGTCGVDNYNPNVAGHVSGRNFDKPGWAYVSSNYHPCENAGQEGNNDWRNRLFAVKLDGSGTIMHFGYSRSSLPSPLATVNRAGTKMIFHSDWDLFGHGEHQVDNEPIRYLSFLAEYANALPVEMVDFGLSKYNNKIKINWRTLSEKDNLGFYVEHSRDAESWENIGFVPSKGSGNQRLTYEVLDSNPYEGRNYYRLLQKDFDGQESYSRVLSIFYKGDKMTLFPNPANLEIRFNTKGMTLSQVLIYNILGQVVLEDFSGNTILDISRLKKGQYFVFAQAEGFVLQEKLLVE